MSKRTQLYIVFFFVFVTGLSAQRLRQLAPVTNVKLGDNVTLECATQNSETATRFVWFHGDSPQQIIFYAGELHNPHKRYKSLSYSNRLSRILISDVHFEDHGVWECEGSFGDDPAERTMTRLSIKSPPEWQNVTEKKTHSLNLGRSLELNCSAKGDPAPTVTWTGDTGAGGIILPDGSVTEYYIGSVLKLGNVTDRHRGRYFCQASNGISPAIQAEFMVKVPFKPVVTVYAPTVRAPRNHSYQIGCVVKAHPQVRVQSAVLWYHGSNQITNGEDDYQYSVSPSEDQVESITILTTPKVDNSVIGEYRCEATNSQGRGDARIQLTAGPAIKPDTGAMRSGAASMSSILCLMVTMLVLVAAKL